MSNTEFTRKIEFTPAFDKRHRDPAKDYGIGAVTMRFVLIGPAGAVHWLMSTGWYLPGLGREPSPPEGWDLGYHSPVPLREGQHKRDDCPYLDGAPCYSDGSALNAEPVLGLFLAGGDEAVWRELERYYRSRLGEPVPA